MIGETGERKSAVATPDGKSRTKKKKKTIVDDDMRRPRVRPPVAFRERMSTCSIDMSVHMPPKYLSDLRTVNNQRLVNLP